MSMLALSSNLKPLIQRAVKSQATRAMTVLSKQSGEEYRKLNYTSRMNQTGRPVSPHVAVFAFPVTAISSITGRLTGVAMSVGAAGLGSMELLGGSGTALAFMESLGSSGFLLSSGAKFCVGFPIVYHYGVAIRHIIWDFYPDLLENEKNEKSSYALFGGATLISLGLMFA